MAQAEGKGVDLITLRALVEEASQAGATRALGALGLGRSAGAARHGRIARAAVGLARRQAERAAGGGGAGWCGCCWRLLLIGLAVRLRLTDLLVTRVCSVSGFAGYAAIFDRPDRGGDVVRKGAFVESLKRAEAVPLLWQHRPGAVIGRVEYLTEDRRGLRVIAELGAGEDAARAARLLESGKLDGLSFGYRVREERTGAAGCGELKRARAGRGQPGGRADAAEGAGARGGD